MRKSFGVLMACWLACACTAPPPRSPAAGAAAAPVPRAGATLYRVDPAASEIRVLVYRAGALASLGHNHVLLFRPDRGWIESIAPLSEGRFYLQIPLERVLVDDAGLRRQEGADFAGEITQDAKQGTARNMLGEALLDAAHHPWLTVSSVRIAPHGESFTAIMRVSVAGRESEVSADFTLDQSTAGLTAKGQMTLRQSELGLKPFSVMLGALQVQDQIEIKFRIVARRD